MRSSSSPAPRSTSNRPLRASTAWNPSMDTGQRRYPAHPRGHALDLRGRTARMPDAEGPHSHSYFSNFLERYRPVGIDSGAWGPGEDTAHWDRRGRPAHSRRPRCAAQWRSRYPLPLRVQFRRAGACLAVTRRCRRAAFRQHLPGISGADGIPLLRQHWPAAHILMLTLFPDLETIGTINGLSCPG